jgi:aryl-alcohol dehydrogenase-like predicted oxidoreductase
VASPITDRRSLTFEAAMAFTHATLGKTGLSVHRLGLSATYRPGKEAIHRAIDRGVNVFFAYGFDRQMVRTLRDVFKGERERYVLATGAYNLLVGYPNLRRTLEKRLRQFRIDYVDLFLFLGVMKPKQFPDKARDELYRLREEGKLRFMGMSCHDRIFVGELVREGAIDVAMLRYNAAHRGAESEIFPYLAEHETGVVSYTATRWGYLLRRPRGWPKHGRVPTAGECYRFVLSQELDDNLAALERGPLSEEDTQFMREFGDAVHDTKRWFM